MVLHDGHAAIAEPDNGALLGDLVVGVELGGDDAELPDIAEGVELHSGPTDVVLGLLVEELRAMLLDVVGIAAVQAIVAPPVAKADRVMGHGGLAIAAIGVPIPVAPHAARVNGYGDPPVMKLQFQSIGMGMT